jgi:uncharacterized lipoprotein YddW (UPF0748 family)
MKLHFQLFVLLLVSLNILPVAHAQKPEFRAAWVASVVNIDWPSNKNLSTDDQRSEFIALLDMHQRNGMNAVVVQIRPAADAFYPSELEPWSEYLTGKQGKAPIPFYDPLEFMITETHKRNMEFHAWLNPYRAVFNVKSSSIAPDHITRKHPEWFVDYGDASRTTRYFDPGNKQGQDFVTKVVQDIVKRYDVDAIHMDDYFYPYRVAGKEFPDAKTYAQYGKGMSKDTWRRSNVDSIIVKLHHAIQAEKPWVKFGISPFGVWRNQSQDPRGSNTQGGQTNYDDLYADILLWLEKGWIDYVAPQLYWEIGHSKADFLTLLDWWGKNTFGKHCYIGIGYYRAGSNGAWRDRSQLPRQIEAMRKTANIQGAIYYNSSSFKSNPIGWNDVLRENYYKETAPIPEMEWLPKRPAK